MALVHSQVLGGRAGALKGVKVLSIALAYDSKVVDQNIFIADQAYQVVSVEEVHSTKGSDGSAVTLSVHKLTGTSSPNLGVSVMVGTFDLKGNVNTVQSASLHLVVSNRQLAAGDRLSIDVTGTPTAVAGLAVTIVLLPIDTEKGDTGDRRYWLSDA